MKWEWHKPLFWREGEHVVVSNWGLVFLIVLALLMIGGFGRVMAYRAEAECERHGGVYLKRNEQCFPKRLTLELEEPRQYL